MPLARTRRTVYKDQDTEVYGGGAVLVDLNQPIPRPPHDWLVAWIIVNDVHCEYPACDQGALTYIVLNKQAPFVCMYHHGLLTGELGPGPRQEARNEIIIAMVGEILLTSYGRRVDPVMRVVQQLAAPPPVAPKVVPLGLVSFDRPKLGQNPP